MPDSMLWDRYHRLIQDYIASGDEKDLREVISLSQERGLTLETTSGRVAASVRAVLSAYASIGAESMVVDIHRGTTHQKVQEASPPMAADECLLTLSTPELEGDAVIIEVRGRCSDQNLPIVRLDYVSPKQAGSQDTLSQPIEPRQLYDVLRGLLVRGPDAQNDRPSS